MLTAADVRAGIRRDRGPVSAVATVGAWASRWQPQAAARARCRASARSTSSSSSATASPTPRSWPPSRRRPRPRRRRSPTRTCAPSTTTAPAQRQTVVTVPICVATPPGGDVGFAGPATAIGAAVAHAVHGAVLSGARIHQRTVAARGRMA